MKNIVFLLIAAILTSSCSSNRLIHQYKNPDTGFFESNKLFIIGLEGNLKIRQKFEKELSKAFDEEHVRSVKSIDFFEDSFTKEKKSIEELNEIEKTLLKTGFDAILITKIIGSEKRYYTSRMLHEYMTSNQTFEDYYFGNQYKYLKQKGKPEDYTIHIIETSLYCICPDKERELLWRGEIEIKDTKSNSKNISNFIDVLFENLKENELLLINE